VELAGQGGCSLSAAGVKSARDQAVAVAVCLPLLVRSQRQVEVARALVRFSED
jgi:hypothetical protein